MCFGITKVGVHPVPLEANLLLCRSIPILFVIVEGIKKVRRYWMDKKKAAEFHGQLAVLFVQVWREGGREERGKVRVGWREGGEGREREGGSELGGRGCENY